MVLTFKEDGHKYQSSDNTQWLSATGLTKLFTPPFDAKTISEKVSKKPKSKWYGIPPEKIREIWDNESTRATDLGSWYHNQREAELLLCSTIRRDNIDLPIFPSIIYEDGTKYAPDQSLVPGIYPEHFMYLRSAGICGQADRVEVVGNRVDIYDYKTNKEVKTHPYINWEGVRSTMLPPISHLDKTDLTKFALQLSTYMYIILKHNHNLEPGKLQIHHVIFEVAGEDEFGYPITARDNDGQPIVKEVVPYDLPYLKSEVRAMLKYVKTHPEVIKNGNA